MSQLALGQTASEFLSSAAASLQRTPTNIAQSVQTRPNTIMTELAYTAEVWINRVLERAHKMANRNTKVQKKGSNYGGYSFVECTLGTSDREAFTNWATNVEKNWTETLVDLFADGYKISVRWVDANNCYMAMLQATDPDEINGGLMLTSRSDVWVEAVLLCAYKHIVMFKSGHWVSEKGASAWG